MNDTVRSLCARRLIGPLWTSLLLDGSTVIARRYGLREATAIRRGIDANLQRGGPTVRIVVFREWA